jgi:multidrug efflux pump subunit AcrB/outer membrane protein TolC
VRAALRYPQVTLVLSGFLFMAGFYALLTMPRREDPKITIRTGIVAAIYPGATSAEVEDQVTRKIEERLFRFEEVRRDKTFSTTRNGMVIVNVELNKQVKDADEFWSKLRLDMAQLKATELPAGVRGPIVDSDFGDTVAVLIAVHGGHYGYRELKDYAQAVETGLRVIPAVSKIKRIGDQKEEIDISTSSERLSQYSVNPLKVMQALQGRNTPQYAGRVPAGQSKVPIESGGRLQTEDEIRQVIVDVSPTGQPVTVGNLATVERVYKDPAEYARIDGEQTILMAVEMHEGNNIVDFGNTVRATLKNVQSTLPPGVKLDLVADQPKVVSDRIGDFFREFGIAIVAVILVTMLLLPMRVALVSAIAIPVSVSMTFGMLNACGIELHQVSISALIVVLGMVVDNAIVIVDNYVGLLDRKVPVDEAAERCATEMSVPVLTATLAIIAAFAPLVLLTGAVGEFIRALPIAVAISLGTSFFVAMLLTPLMARFFIRKGLVDHSLEDSGEPRKLTPLDHMQKGYNHVITWAMLHKQLVLLSSVVAFVAGVAILRLVPQLFFPLAERDQFVMDVWLPEGAKIEATDAAVRQIEAVLSKEQQVKMYASFLGESAPRFYYNVNPQAPAANYAQILVNTKRAKDTPKLVERMRELLPDVVPEAKVFVKELQQGQIMEAPVEVRIVGNDIPTLHALGNQTEEVLRHTPGAIYIHTDWHEDAWQVGVNVREEVANRMGLTNAGIAQQLAAGFEGAPVTTFWEGDRGVDVVLRLDPADRQSFQNVTDTYVMSPVTGAKVPLQAVASLTSDWQPGRIVRRNGVRTLTVRAFPGDHWLASEILGHARKQLDTMPLPQGYRIEYGGEFENQQEVSGELRNALLISLVLIFLILLFQFRTLIDPLIVMVAFPLALPGAAFGLLITRNTFGFTAFIGIISVGGLVVRNSIILIDYIHERMKDGVELEKAALEAGERRLRPIFLTSAAAAVGVIPMIISGSSLWSPLASVIAFGLLGSMVFTLVAIPVLFVVAHKHSRSPRSQKRDLVHPASTEGDVIHSGWGSWFPTLAAKTKTRQGWGTQRLLLLLLTLTCVAQGETRRITLDEAVALATKQNPIVKMARLKTKEMDARVGEARANYFPVLSNESAAAHLRSIEHMEIPMGALGVYPVPGPVPGADTSLPLGHHNFLLSTTTAAQPITQYFKIHAGVAVAHADASIARNDARQAEDEVALKMKELYYNLLSAERRKQAAELRIAAGEERLDEARNGVEAGAVLELRVLEGKAQIAEARHGLGSLEDAISDMKVEFNDLAGLPLETDVELVTPQVDSSDATAGDLETEALQHNPEVAAAQQTLKKARAGLSAAHAEYIPEIGAFAQFIHQDGVPLLTENNGALGLKMNWTLFEFGKRSGQVHERQAQVAEAEENLRHAENRVRVEIEKSVRKVRRAESGLEAARESVEARTEMRRITANQVEAKTVNASALKEADAQLAEAEAGLFQAEVERSTARADLERTLGQE